MPIRVPRLVTWLLTLAWAAAIFYTSSQPGSTLPGGWSVQGHLGEYFVFGALLSWALSGRRIDATAVALAVVLASLYGVTDEFHQHFVAMRTPDVADWMLDTVGAVVGAFTARAYTLRLARRALSSANGESRTD
jgi:VanZ family protein